VRYIDKYRKEYGAIPDFKIGRQWALPLCYLRIPFLPSRNRKVQVGSAREFAYGLKIFNLLEMR
jgi:hypothetical protein